MKPKPIKYITAPKLQIFTNILYCADCGTGLRYRSNRAEYIVEAMHVMVKKECTAHTKKELFIGNYIG